MVGEWIIWVLFKTGFVCCTIFWGLGIIITLYTWITNAQYDYWGTKNEYNDPVWPLPATLTGCFIVITGLPVLIAGIVKFT